MEEEEREPSHTGTRRRQQAGDRPLSGVRVIDMTRVVAGPLCGRILADLGADVIKIEPPQPDLTRSVRPLLDGTSPYFTQLNAGKRAVTVDLTAPGGAALVTSMAADADVLLENFRPGVLARFGLNAEQLRADHARLVYCSISGYGQRGRWSGRRAFAPAIHAETGLIDVIARRSKRDPAPLPQSHADTYAGIMAASAITTALYQRERTGIGQHLDVSLAGVSIFANEWTALELAGGDDADWFGPLNTIIVQLGDDSWAATVGHPALLFPKWADAMGRPDLLDDDRLATRESRHENRELVHGHIRAFARTQRDFAALEHACEPHGLVVGRIRSISELSDTEWAHDTDPFASVGLGIQIPKRPWTSSVADIGAERAAPGYGEHTDEVCAELGLDDEAIARLRSDGALR